MTKMNIEWLGHACFILTSGKGTRILTDPFDPSVGYDMPSVEVDAVTASHDHYDHYNIKAVKGRFEPFTLPGKYTVKDIRIKGVSSFHDAANGARRGKNVIFIFEIDELKVCHCGDLGHPLDPETAAEIGAVDILLVPVGGIYTIDASGAFSVVKTLKPAVTIPMHYRTPALKFELDTVDGFIDMFDDYRLEDKREIEFTKANLGGYSRLICLNSGFTSGKE